MTTAQSAFKVGGVKGAHASVQKLSPVVVAGQLPLGSALVGPPGGIIDPVGTRPLGSALVGPPGGIIDGVGNRQVTALVCPPLAAKSRVLSTDLF